MGERIFNITARGIIVEEEEEEELVVIQDITERKQAEELYLTLANSSPVGVYIVQNRKFQFVNPMFQEYTDFSQDELLSMDPLNIVHPDDREMVRENAIKMLKVERSSTYEFRSTTRDGKTRWVMETVTSTHYKGKRATLGNYMDITERKKAEAEKRKFEQRAQAASRLASVGEMAAGIAHEVNNPLTSVIGFAQLLMEEDVPEDIKEYAKTINDGAQRVASIVKRLLTFARQQRSEREYVDINQIIKTTLQLRAYEMKTSNIKVTTQLDSDLSVTMADVSQLQQMFLNIIINAETEMKLAHGRGNLLIKTKAINNTIRISFKDDGPGIVKEILGRVFDPFFTTREVGEGTGLGLSVCHGIATEHGGRIYAKSKLGKGATFIVELPVITEDEQLKLTKPATDKSERVA